MIEMHRNVNGGISAEWTITSHGGENATPEHLNDDSSNNNGRSTHLSNITVCGKSLNGKS